ncbi:LysR family transcriptional regulator [Acidaminococcus fermentans]|uniref:LysR family transcriptional regulator n=1 Tax=Acidaminococcus fermentans TaxID=905 RepID=UPI00242D9A23|nr:LysR family transcriptional regulator [Acidaminococcus fermentans]
MFHEKYLRDFLLVCEKGNITAAAKQLGLSQPSLSRIVKAVEKEAGMPLLVRDPNGVCLTQAGEIYARIARNMLEGYREALQEIHDIRDSRSGQIRLGLSRISSETLLPVILEQFRTLYPRVELLLTETLIRNLNPLLHQGRLDLALTYFSDDPDLEYTALLTDTVYLEAPPFFYQRQPGWTYGTSNVLQGTSCLQQQPFILLKPGRGLRHMADTFFRREKLRPRIVLETDSVELAHRLALANHGFALVPGLAFHTLQKVEQGVFYQVPSNPLTRTLYLARRKGAYLTRAMAALSGLIRNSAEGKPLC